MAIDIWNTFIVYTTDMHITEVLSMITNYPVLAQWHVDAATTYTIHID